MKRLIALLNDQIIQPLITHPIIHADTVNALNIRSDLVDIKRALGIDKRSSYIPLILVRDIDTGLTLRGDIKLMQLKDTQKCRIEFGAPVDKKGNLAKVQEGSVSISITDDSAHFEPDPSNPFAGTVVADKPTADATKPGAIVIVADADLGDGVNNIQGTEPLIVVAGDAVGFGVASVGTPEEQ
jgi:hypothetical protein